MIVKCLRVALRFKNEELNSITLSTVELSRNISANGRRKGLRPLLQSISQLKFADIHKIGVIKGF